MQIAAYKTIIECCSFERDNIQITHLLSSAQSKHHIADRKYDKKNIQCEFIHKFLMRV